VPGGYGHDLGQQANDEQLTVTNQGPAARGEALQISVQWRASRKDEPGRGKKKRRTWEEGNRN